MTDSQTQSESEPSISGPRQPSARQETDGFNLETLTGLSDESLDAFCADISGMFGVDITCNRRQSSSQTREGLETQFEKLVAVYSVRAEGSLNGTFQLLFDQEALFTLAGIVAMHPEQTILQNRTLGTLDDARNMSEILAELGDTLVWAWDRVLRKVLEGHGGLVQTDMFVGNPADRFEGALGLSDNEGFVLITYDITIAPASAFRCGVAFSKTSLVMNSLSTSDKVASIGGQMQGPEAAGDNAASGKADAARDSDGAEHVPESSASEESTVDEPQDRENCQEDIAGDKPEDAADRADPVNEQLGDTSQPASDVGPDAAAAQETQQSDPNASDSDAQETTAATEQVNESEKGPEAAGDNTASGKADAARDSDGAEHVPESSASEESTVDGSQDRQNSQEDIAGYKPEDAADQANSINEQLGDTSQPTSDVGPDAAAAQETQQSDPNASDSDAQETTAVTEQVNESDLSPEAAGDNTASGKVDAARDGDGAEHVPEGSASEESTVDGSQDRQSNLEDIAGDKPEDAADRTDPVDEQLGDIRARDIMQKDIIWCSPDDSIEHCLTNMEQHNAEWLLAGYDGVLEGMVSKADLTGATSPYLRPEFARWRRPLDDATLRIKIRWFMNTRVRTITPETSLTGIIKSMHQLDTLCLPVVKPSPHPQMQSTTSPTQQGEVQGLVTVCDVFKVLLESKGNI
ncbi:MAG: CBS domain-containing protein [Planctomycetota bacterium]|jgi:CBS domain-containing protein